MELDTSKLEISNSELLKGLTSTSLSVIDYLVKIDAQEDADKVNAYSKTVIDGIKSLQGAYDPDVVKIVEDGLDTLETASKDSDFKEGYQDGMSQLYQYGSLALNGIKEREKILEGYESDLLELENNMPALENRTVDSSEIIGKIQDTQIAISNKVYDSVAKKAAARISDIVKRQESINMIKKMDQSADKYVQIELDNFNTEYHKEALKALGFVQLKDGPSEEYADFVLPDDMKMNINNYKDASDFLDKIVENDIKIAQAAIYEDETRPLEIVRDMMAIGDSNETDIARAIGEKLFAAEDTASDIAAGLEGDNLKRYTQLINELEQLKKSGKYNAEFNNMQTDYINMTKALDRVLADKSTNTAKDFTQNVSSELEYSIKSVNESIETLNAGLKGKDKQGTLPAFSKDSEVLATVSQTKRSLVNKLKDIVEQEDNASGFSAPYWDETLFKSLKAANSVETQYILMDELIDKYIKDGIMQDISTPIENTKRASVVEDILKAFAIFSKVSPNSPLTQKEKLIKEMQAAEGNR